MGNSYPNAQWCPDPRIVQVVNAAPHGGSLQKILLRKDLKDLCVDVNVGSGNQNNAWREHHKIAFDTEKPVDYYLIVLFPCHPKARKRILYTYNYSTVIKLNREINQRLRDSLNVSYDYEVSQMVIICGSVIYKLKNLMGTGYIVWASYVNTTNHNHVVHNIQQHIPIFVHMDGYNQFESVLRLVPRVAEGNQVETLNVATTQFFIPFKVFLWTDESDPREQRVETVDVATYEQVVDQCSDEADDAERDGSLIQEPLPFSAPEALSSTSGSPRAITYEDLSSDAEVDALSNLSEGALYIGSGTPRLESLPNFIGIYDIDAKDPDETIKNI